MGNAEIRQQARTGQATAERQVTLRFTPAKLGGGVEGDTVAKALGQRIIDTIVRYWNNQVPIKTIIRKVNGGMSPSEALSIIDIYAILFVALGEKLVKDSNSTGDIGISAFADVFKAWKKGHDRATLYRLFPKVGERQIDRCVRACQRRVEAELQKERDRDLANQELSPEASEFLSRIRALDLSPELFKRLHTDDANAVRYGEFRVVDGRPAFVLFLSGEGKQDERIAIRSGYIRHDINKSNSGRNSLEPSIPNVIEPEVESAGEREAERIEEGQEGVEGCEAPPAATISSQEANQAIEQRTPQFDQPQLAKLDSAPAAARPTTLAEQARQIRELTSRGKNPDIVDHAREFQFSGLSTEQEAQLEGPLGGQDKKTLPRKVDASTPPK